MIGRSLVERLLATASESLARDGEDLTLLTTVEAAMVVADAMADDMPLVFANAAFVALTGYGPDEVIGRNCRFLQGPRTDPAACQQFRAGLASRQPFQVTLVNYRKDGTPFRNQVFVSPVRDAEDRVSRFIGMQILVDSAADAGRPGDEGLQLRELRHRFKNHIQAMTSLVSLQARRARSPDAAEALEDLRARFEALATLYRDIDQEGQGEVPLRGFLTALAAKIGQLYDPSDRHHIACDVADVGLTHNQAAVVGQVLTELLINIYRHAFAGREGGSAMIRLVAEQGWLELTVADDGPGTTKSDAGRGHLGLSIIASLARSLDGTFEHGSGQGAGGQETGGQGAGGGFTGRLRFPLAARDAG
jgi:PAS domain S-box-containing protein